MKPLSFPRAAALGFAALFSFLAACSENASENGTSSTYTGELEMVLVEGGTFTMGCTAGQRAGEEACSSYEKAHEETLGSFYIGKYEVTQKQWEAVTGSNPSYDTTCGNDCPVERVSWNDVQTFIAELNKQTGLSYRLPTEAEWEFAARGGNAGVADDYLFAGSDSYSTVAWVENNARAIHPVGSLSPNQLGIYDMSGNVWEWTSDLGWSSDSSRVLRGGSWGNYGNSARVAKRNKSAPNNRYNNNGFRLALSP
jgi:formylglycine-generating enzyme required for sulfatase activity